MQNPRADLRLAQERGTLTRSPALTPAQAIAAFSAAVTGANAAGISFRLPHRICGTGCMTWARPSPAETSPTRAHKVVDLIHHLGNLANDGQLTAAGQRSLAAPMAALERAIAPQT